MSERYVLFDLCILKSVSRRGAWVREIAGRKRHMGSAGRLGLVAERAKKVRKTRN
jgi:hypothetical protein